MAGNYAQLLDIINNPTDHSLPAWDNNNKLIEGLTVKQYLLTIISSLTVGYQFMGVATPSTSPGTPDQNVFYVASTPGIYSNFDSFTLKSGQLVVFIYNGSWSSNIIFDGSIINAEYLLTLNMTGDNVFDPNYIRRNKIVQSSSPFAIIDFADAYITKYYRVPSTCEKITISGVLGSETRYWRLSKEPNDTAEAIAGNSNGNVEIEMTAERRQYPYLCVTISRGILSPDFSGVVISFGDIRTNIQAQIDAINTELLQIVGSDIPETPAFSVVGNIAWATGVVQSLGYHSTELIRVAPGNVITMSGMYGSASVAGLAAYDSDGIYLQSKSIQGATAEQRTYVVPAGVAYIRLCTDDVTYLTATVSILHKSLFVPWGQITNDQNADNDKIPTLGLVKDVKNELAKGFNYDNSILTTSGTLIYIQDGGTSPHDEFDCGLAYYQVTSGQRWRCLFNATGTAGICFYDSDKIYINQYWQSNGSVPEEFTVPENAAFARFCNRRTIVASPYFKMLQDYDNLQTLTDKLNALAAPEFSRPLVRLYPQTKLPVCSFQFDDIPAKDSQIVSLFESYKLTCAFAFIASTNNIATRGPIYKEYQQRGFQIMNHSVDGKIFNLQNYSYQTALEAIFTALKRIQDAGMVCNGFVAPSSSMEPSFMPILKLAQAYAFTSATTSSTANGRNQNTCDLHRYSLESHTLAEAKQFIDDCIANDQIITFYGHAADLIDEGDTSVWSLAKIAAIVEYCIEKRDAGLLYLGGTDDCVKYYFGL